MSDTNVVLLGVGAIGRELLRQLATNHRTSVSSIRVCALVDRSGFVFEPAGLSWRRVMELRAHKASGKSLATAEGGHPSIASTRSPASTSLRSVSITGRPAPTVAS